MNYEARALEIALTFLREPRLPCLDPLYAKFLWEAGVPGYEPDDGRVPYALADCPVCGTPAISPKTGECLACEGRGLSDEEAGP